MNVFLVSEDEALARSIRHILMREQVYCPLSSVISFDQAIRRLGLTPPDLIIAVLPEDPIRSVEALEMLAAIPRTDRTLVIAIGPAADAKLVIKALRGMVDDYLDIGDLENELVMVLQCWTRRWSADRPEGKLVAVLAPSGGAGSSTIAANIAVEAARELKEVALIDLKLETGDLAALLDLKPTHSLSDLCRNLDRLDQVFFLQSLIAQLQVLRQADLILVVLRLDFTSLKNVTKLLEHLDGLGIQSDRVRLIANRVGQPKEVPLSKVEEALKTKVFHVIPDDPATINRANNNGVPVVIDSKKSKVARSLATLSKLLQTTLKVQSLPAPEKSSSVAESQPMVHAATSVNYRPNIGARPSKVEVVPNSRN
jgi:pilus assembly protein CpaE